MESKRISTAARELGISRITVARWITTGKLTGTIIDTVPHVVVDEKYRTIKKNRNII